MEPGTTHSNEPDDNASRRVFLRNLTALGAAGVPAAMFADKARAAGDEPLRLAQADEPKPKPRTKPQITKVVDKGDFKTLQEIVLDGGILRGSDVVKALCLGARAVGVGKLMGYALAAGGEGGVRCMLELMAAEIRSVMGLIGATSLAQLNPARVKRAMPVQFPGVTSAYPWFEEHARG